MLPLLMLLPVAAQGSTGVAASAATYAPAAASEAERATPVTPAAEAKAKNILLAPGASLLAATWDAITDKPAKPRHIGMACLVMAEEGMPISCLPSEPRFRVTNLGEWNDLFANYLAKPTASPGDRELADLAAIRLYNSRLRPDGSDRGKVSWRMLLFDEVFAPTDARPKPPLAEQALTMNQVSLDKPFDPALLQSLYPLLAQRYQVTAHVTIACRIETDRSLLCRQPATISTESVPPAENANLVYNALVFASYQAASMIRLSAKAKDGSAVVGRDLTMSFKWTMPEGQTLPTIPDAPGAP